MSRSETLKTMEVFNRIFHDRVFNINIYSLSCMQNGSIHTPLFPCGPILWFHIPERHPTSKLFSPRGDDSGGHLATPRLSHPKTFR